MCTRPSINGLVHNVFMMGLLFGLVACSSDNSPTGNTVVADPATVTVTARDSKISANLNARVSNGTQDTFDSDESTGQELTPFQANIMVGGDFNDGGGNTAGGSGSVDQLSSLSAQGSPDVISGFQANGSISGGTNAKASEGLSITARSSGSNTFDLDFVPEDGPVEIRISGSFTLEGENSFGFVDLNGRDGSGQLLGEEFEETSPSLAFEYTITLAKDERFEFGIAIVTAVVAFADNGGSNSASGSASFLLEAEFRTLASPN